LYKRIFLLLCAAGCYAADWSSLYDSSKLEAEKPRLRTAINYLLEKEIQPFIPPQEATAFGLQAIDLPVSGLRSDPLDYYSTGGHIILPVSTLLFIEDLSKAYGWLWVNRFSTKTLDEYLIMLRYRSAAEFPDGKYPAPLAALHVPDNALSDPKVVEAALRLRRTAYAFILLHQFAHLQMHAEPNGRRGYSEAQEESADGYALNIMKENSATPTGVLLIMQSLLFFEAGDPGELHPVTSQRLEAMAKFLDRRSLDFTRGRPDKATGNDAIHAIASLLMEGSEWLAVRGHQAELEQLAMKTDPSKLAPRPLPRTTR
jgi:hypothetical protein